MLGQVNREDKTSMIPGTRMVKGQAPSPIHLVSLQRTEPDAQPELIS